MATHVSMRAAEEERVLCGGRGGCRDRGGYVVRREGVRAGEPAQALEISEVLDPGVGVVEEPHAPIAEEAEGVDKGAELSGSVSGKGYGVGIYEGLEALLVVYRASWVDPGGAEHLAPCRGGREQGCL